MSIPCNRAARALLNALLHITNTLTRATSMIYLSGQFGGDRDHDDKLCSLAIEITDVPDTCTNDDIKKYFTSKESSGSMELEEL